LRQRNNIIFNPSRLFLYYNSRYNKTEDTGATLRESFAATYNLGICPENEWVYDANKFATPPPQQPCYNDAKKCRTVEYINVTQTIEQVKSALADGNPVVLGFDVFQSFQDIGKDGKMPIPNRLSEKFLGGHAVCAVGYDDAITSLIVRNSWGSSWGNNGYFYMPYQIVNDTVMSSSYWFMRSVTNPLDIVIPEPTPPKECCQCM
jgi:C1A family cysteine protease